MFFVVTKIEADEDDMSSSEEESDEDDDDDDDDYKKEIEEKETKNKSAVRWPNFGGITLIWRPQLMAS